MRKLLAASLASILGLGCLSPTAAQAPVQLLYLAEDVPVSLNPDGPSSVVNTTQVGRINIMEPLFAYPVAQRNEDGIGIPDFTRFEGRLVERWEFDEAATTWTLHLRRGVTGCSGNEFTADDVAYTLERAKSVSGTTATGWFAAAVAGIKGFNADVFKPGADKSLGDALEVVDPYTVRIKQGGPNAFFLLGLSLHPIFIFDAKAMRARATEQDPWSHLYANTENIFGYGPYCLERWTKGDEFIVRANPRYYRGKPPVDRIVMKKVPQSSNRVVTLRSGQAGLVQGLTPREYAALKGARGVTVGGVYGNESLFIAPNFKSPVWGNPTLREALAYAIDYDQVLATGYLGQARRWEGLIPSSFPGATRTMGKYRFDPERARQLLAQAGFPGGAGLEKFTEDMKLTYAAEREATLGPIAVVLQTSMRAAGFPVVLDPVSQSQMASRRMVNRDLPLALSDIDKAVAVDAVYAVNLYFLKRELGGVTNSNNYDNPRVNDMLLAARANFSPEARLEAAAKMQEIIAADLAWIPVAETRTQWAYSAKLTGLDWFPDNSIRWSGLGLAR